MDKNLSKKYEELKKEINRLGCAVVAFSGGIDSTLVLKAAHDALGKNAIAVTADSPSLPRIELEDAKKIARQIGAKHIIIATEETKSSEYLKNPANRCYYCKTELYSKLRKLADELKIKHILNGTNFDDLSDYRPGLEAAAEFKVASPLKEAKLAKNEVRELARHVGLEVWDKPSSPCLSSRVPHGQEITLKKLAMVEEAENFLKGLGISELRVRHFGKAARIDVSSGGKQIISDNFSSIKRKFNEIGFEQVSTADFRSGSLNLMLKAHAGD